MAGFVDQVRVRADVGWDWTMMCHHTDDVLCSFLHLVRSYRSVALDVTGSQLVVSTIG